MGITCFLPCRKGSERVPRKNIKTFAGFEHGLVEVKLRQLDSCEVIDEIILSTNDEEIISYAESLKMDRLIVNHREERLCSSTTSTDELVPLAMELANCEHILWTHVTSPFFTSGVYCRFIDMYSTALQEGYDSLMSVKELRSFIWNEDGPVNHEREVEKWPRTQTLKPLFEVDSGAFLNSRRNYAEQGDRIGSNPQFFVSPGHASFDIDWPEDHILAQEMVVSGVVDIWG